MEKIDKQELLPCPFCGSTDLHVSVYDFRKPYEQDIVCMNCNGGISGEKGKNSRNNWNMRKGGGYTEQWVDCIECGLSVNPKTIICSACAQKSIGVVNV